MSVMIEALYKAPVSLGRERAISDIASQYGGKVTYRENNTSSVCLTIEFQDWKAAQDAKTELGELCDLIDGPMDY